MARNPDRSSPEDVGIQFVESFDEPHPSEQQPDPHDERKERTGPSGSVVIVSVALCVVVLGGIYYALFQVLPMTQRVLIATGVISFAYFACAYVFDPTPEMDNLGWFGGMIDNPFSWEDDWNRNKLAMAIALLPGKFVIKSFAALFSLIFK